MAELLSHIDSIDNEFSTLEEKGREMEGVLRHSVSDSSERRDFLVAWIDLCQKHCRLLHQQNEYAYLLRERQLDDLHTEVEYQLRCLIEKPESTKEPGDDEKEAYLLQKLLKIIEEKSRLAESNVSETTLSDKGIDLTEADSVGKQASEGKQQHSTEKSEKKKKHLKQRLKNLKKKIINTKK